MVIKYGRRFIYALLWRHFRTNPPTGPFNLAFPLFLWLDGLQKLLLRSLFPFFPRWIFVQMLPLMSIKFEQTTRAK